MGVKAKQGNGGNFAPVPAGTHHAICYAVIDLGTHHKPRFDKTTHEVVITWEIPGERIEIDNKDKPRAISKTYTLSLHEKSNLHKDLVAWRGKPFTSKELEGFDLENVLGANCLIQIVHNEKNGNTYANVEGVSALMKNQEKKKPENPLVSYSIDEHGDNIPEGVPGWAADKIRNAQEFQGQQETKSQSTEDIGTQPAKDDDGIPF